LADLFAISEVKDKVTSHAIFLHGLGGHHYRTWCSLLDPNICWLQWLAEDIEGLAVWSVKYEAAVSRWHGSAMHLTDRATNVFKRILVEPKLKTGKIILIGHSYGGLVIKQLLRTADSMSHQHSDAAEFVGRVRRVAFLATPHSGADVPTWMDRLRIIFLPSVATACLVRNDPNLRELNHWYREWSSKHSIEHLILSETQPTHKMFLVVKPESSDPGLLVRPTSIDADHFTICKPKDRFSEVYLHVCDFMERPIGIAHRDTVIESALKIQNLHLETLIETTHKATAQAGEDLSSLSQSISEHPEKTADLIMDRLLTEGSFAQSSSHKKYPKELVDNEIEKSISDMRRARFFKGFSVSEHSIRLAYKIQGGELEGGSDGVKCRALAWCARFLAYSEDSDKSDSFLCQAKKLGGQIEIIVADAFRVSAGGNLEGALSKLATIESPIARAAALFIVNHHNDAVTTIEWLSNSGITFSGLDAEGKFLFLMKLLEIGRWDKAFEYASELSEDDFQGAPALFHSAAMAYLLQTIPDEYRSLVLMQVPFHARTFRLASNEFSLQMRRRAQNLFHRCFLAARELDCLDSANLAEDYALWLELRDPTGLDDGRKKLQTSMRDSAHYLRRIPLALEFGIKLDLKAVEQEIERQTALSGGNSHDASLARFSLALTQETPKAVADYIDRHRAQLQEHLEKKSILMLEVEVLARSGQPQEAEKLLTEFSDDGLSESEQSFLRKIIAESKGVIDSFEVYKSQFENTDKLRDLVALVNLLEQQKDWKQLCHFGSILFERTQALSDALLYVRALYEASQYSDIVIFLKKFPEFLEQSDDFQIPWSWSLYFEGLLTESAVALAALMKKRDHLNDRALRVNLAIATGEWDTLLMYVEEEWGKRVQRDAGDLIQTAQLAQLVGSPRAKQLAHVAAKDTDDPVILATAYFLASRAGWEDESTAAQWLHRAAELSGENGPLQKMTLKDLQDRKPDWDRREDEAWQQLNDGNLPIFGAASLLNRSLVDMILLPALANPLEQDPRRRVLVPAYSGVRQPCPCDYRVVAMDATALLTLGVLGLFDVISDFFECVIIPHSTLRWLFGEKQNITFHQPSRIKDAHKLRQLLANGALKELNASVVVNVELVAEVGEEIASLIAEAQEGGIDSEKQRFVVRSSPVHRIGSLMEEEADLSPYYANLCSCLSVVNKLKQKGQLTATEDHRARSYLSLHEKEWPHQLEISDGAVLYLDNLSVAYLQHIGILEKLKSAGLEVYISARKIEDINALIRYEQLSGEVNKIIEVLRSFLAAGIQTGKIKVNRISQVDKADESMFLDHPTFAIFELVKDVEAIITDDRFLNQHLNVDSGSGHTPILTTLDLINDLHSKRNLSLDQMFDCRTTLRRAGYLFIPLTSDELTYHLSVAEIVDDCLIETAELKAIRENLLRIRMSSFFQLPKEAPWLHGIMRALVHTLKAQWQLEVEEKKSIARSVWLRGQIDMRGWAHCLGGEGGLNMVNYGYGAQIVSLLFAPENSSQEVEAKYWKWIEERVLTEMCEKDPELYSWLLKRVKELILNFVETELSKEIEQ